MLIAHASLATVSRKRQVNSDESAGGDDDDD